MTHRRALSTRLPITSPPLNSSLLPSMASPTSISPSLSSKIFANVTPRKSKYRITTFLALFVLVVLSTYIFFVSGPQFSLAPLRFRTNLTGANVPIVANDDDRPSSRLFRYPQLSKHRKAGATVVVRPQVQLTEAQELAAVTSFLASLPQNVIPPSVDPEHPIDPQLVLDFDTRSPRAEQEILEMVDDVWMRNPVIVFSKLHSPISREIKTILANMNLRPSPTIFEVDQRSDADVLMPLLFRLTHSTDLPILLVGGQPVGPITHIRTLSESGELRSAIQAAGAVLDGAKKKFGRH